MNTPLHNEPGWFGFFTRDRHPGAYANGTRVEKIEREEGDTHPIGARATVLGSAGDPAADFFIYFVEWDDTPRVAVAILSTKVKAVPHDA